MKNKWQESEDLILKEIYPSHGLDKCMNLLSKRSKYGIRSRIQFLGLKSNQTNPQKLLEKFIKEIKGRGGMPLFEALEWKGCGSRYPVRCSCGYEWMAMPTALWARGDWCKKCSGHLKKTAIDYHDMATKYGGTWIGTEVPKNNKVDTLWICAQGHQFENDYNNIQQYNCFCRYCKNPYIGQTVTKMYLEALTGLTFHTLKPSFLKYDNGHPLELDGYNRKAAIAFEYNGLEHYKRSARQSQKAFEDLQKRDLWKHKAVLENGIKLLIIDEIDGKFDEKHIKKSIVSFLIKESISIVIDHENFHIDFKKIYNFYDLERMSKDCKKLNLTLLSDVYVTSTTKIKIRCNVCNKERFATPGNITHMANKGRASYCKCASRKPRTDKYNSMIARYGFKIVSNNYETHKTILTIQYPDGSLHGLSWQQFYWDHLPRILEKNSPEWEDKRKKRLSRGHKNRD